LVASAVMCIIITIWRRRLEHKRGCVRISKAGQITSVSGGELAVIH
jgi:hypothetical protein